MRCILPAYRAQNGYDSDFWFVSSFNMSVRTLNIYDIPQTVTEKLNINGARICDSNKPT
jgi:hypothetical protein